MDGEVLSPVETVARDRGRALKRYVRAAAALRGLYDDVSIGEAVGVNRGAVAAWWDGAQMKPETIRRLAEKTGLSFEDLTRFVYLDGPPPKLPEPSGPAGLREGVRRGQEHPDDATPGRPTRSRGRLPRGGGAGHE
jgi:hypothetical protein